MKLTLFFTEGVSLQTWDRVGILDREIKPYNKLAGLIDRIYFITYGDKNDLKYAEKLAKNIIILPKKINLPNRLYSLLIPFFHRKELKEADIYKTNQMLGSWSAVLGKIFFRKKLIVRCGYQLSLSPLNWQMGFFKKMLAGLIEYVSYKMADHIIITSNSARDYIMRRYKIIADKIEVLSNYVDVDLFKAVEAQKIKNSIVYVGRLGEEKNLMSFFEAMVGLDVTLIIFGTGSQEVKLKQYVQENNLHVEFRGNIPNNQLPEELSKYEIFILPSLYEGNPKVLLEAMACALPVVGTNVRGIREIIRHKENGYLCEISSNSIKNAIIKVLGDEELKIKMGKNARQYIEENCALDKIIERENQIYRRLS